MGRRTRNLLFLILFFTWIFWISAGFISKANHSSLIVFLHYAGGAVPLIATLSVLYFHQTVKERKDYLLRLLDLKRIGSKWILIIVLLIPILALVSSWIDTLLGGEGLDLSPLQSLVSAPLSLFPFAFFILVFGPIPEEMTWRGLILNRMEKEITPFRSNLILGIYWLVWHLPLFFIDGSYQASLGVGTPQFFLFILDKVPYTFLLAWIFHHTKRSTLAAILFHFIMNFMGELLDLRVRAESILIILLYLITLFIIFFEKDEWFSERTL